MLPVKSILVSISATIAVTVASTLGAGSRLETLSTTVIPEGILTIYGSRESPQVASPQDRPITSRQSCGTNDLLCSDRYAASKDTCATLVEILDAATMVFPYSASRAVCLDQAGDRCCTSWSVSVDELQEYVLLFAAEKILNGCNYGGNRVGGSARNVLLMGTCVTQCLSNRPDGCY